MNENCEFIRSVIGYVLEKIMCRRYVISFVFGVFIVKFEHISDISFMFSLMTLNKQVPVG